MKKHVYHGWKGVLVAMLVLVVLGSTVQAVGTATDSQDVTLSATVREPSGTTGTIAFSFELEDAPATSAMMPNYSTLPPQPSAVPEPSTLVLIGLGLLGLVLLRKRCSPR